MKNKELEVIQLEDWFRESEAPETPEEHNAYLFMMRSLLHRRHMLYANQNGLSLHRSYEDNTTLQ